jgi:hypothetical protein
MKKILILPTLISFTMICSCQKQDTAADQELAQRKTELDSREEAFDERLNALNEKVNALDARVKALAEREQANANRTTPSDVQRQIPDPAQVQAERERIQQLAAQMRSSIPDHSKMKAERDRQRQLEMEKLQSQSPREPKMPGGAVFPAPEAASPTAPAQVEATSPAPSAETEATSPTPSPTQQ